MARRRNYPGSLEKRGDSWRLRLMVDGEMHRFTLKEATRAEVEDLARKKYEELRTSAPGTSAAITRMSNGLDRFESQYLPSKRPNTRPGV